MRVLIPALLLCLSGIGSALADDLPQPMGPVLLTVTGTIANTNADGEARFDLEMLDALPQRVTESETPWYNGVQSFSGVKIEALLDAVGADGDTVTVTALNDYSAQIPVADFRDYEVIFATRINGETLSVRDKGPLFVIYPFDENPDLYNEVYFGRSVWQVTAMSVE
ncbi:oxidoreductase [Devosia pacifica]|uniref:Oxidoreductase n=1 Tax=Devosia pacifica TaxID=1335967 RepID=A0A918S2Z9_9HYPH|nr:molybdopterin-dependent oxidoreductase [Devosia pacifica]GHA18295.1 oxidoreductase [Devosia pacifica]